MNTKLSAYIIAFLAVSCIALTVRMYKRNRLSTRLFLMWISLWLAIGVFGLFPSVLNKVMYFVNMGNRPFFITTTAILIIYIIIFCVTSAISKIDRKISKLIQEQAILRYKLEDKDSKKESEINDAE